MALLTCRVQRFYPEDTRITWLERNGCSKHCEASSSTKNPDGTFSQDSHILVSASEWEDQRLFTCQVWQNVQVLVQKSMHLSEFGGLQVSLGKWAWTNCAVKGSDLQSDRLVEKLTLPYALCVTLGKSLHLSGTLHL